MAQLGKKNYLDLLHSLNKVGNNSILRANISCPFVICLALSLNVHSVSQAHTLYNS